MPVITNPLYAIYTDTNFDPAISSYLTWQSSTTYSTTIYSVITYGNYDYAELGTWDTAVLITDYANITTEGYVVFEGIIFEQIIGAPV